VKARSPKAAILQLRPRDVRREVGGSIPLSFTNQIQQFFEHRTPADVADLRFEL
jgi:hypothetical protein